MKYEMKGQFYLNKREFLLHNSDLIFLILNFHLNSRLFFLAMLSLYLEILTFLITIVKNVSELQDINSELQDKSQNCKI